ncbi:MAG: hypothetical protein KatS3mg081_1953 [Gemmatimonadales bacterium]|nr:MAG: hypothetical protein KatS3mg081_1953 [Gemmatimonadales bacterium]
MPRTTLVLDRDLHRHLKELAAAEGKTFQAVVNELLRRALAASQKGRFKLEITGWEAVEQPGVDILDRDKLFDLMNGR